MSPSSHSLFSNVSLSEESEIRPVCFEFQSIDACAVVSRLYGSQEDSLSNREDSLSWEDSLSNREDSLSWEDSLMTVGQNAPGGGMGAEQFDRRITRKRSLNVDVLSYRVRTMIFNPIPGAF